MDIDIEQLRTLMQTIEEFDINELEIRNGEERIRLNRGAPVVAAPAVAAAPAIAAAPAAAPAAANAGAEDADAGFSFITSPFVGTFYSAPSPTSDPFIKEGDTVSVGQTICIVEAMKLMNEIESEISGTIVEMVAENGKPVEFGDKLFKVKPA